MRSNSESVCIASRCKRRNTKQRGNFAKRKTSNLHCDINHTRRLCRYCYCVLVSLCAEQTDLFMFRPLSPVISQAALKWRCINSDAGERSQWISPLTKQRQPRGKAKQQKVAAAPSVHLLLALSTSFRRYDEIAIGPRRLSLCKH